MLICYYLFDTMHGFGGLVLRSICFIILYGVPVIYFKLTPDIAAGNKYNP